MAQVQELAEPLLTTEVSENEKGKRVSELKIANKELAYQKAEKKKRAAELTIANKELVFQNNEKEKRAAELVLANKELAFQNDEKEKRAAELIIANKELVFQNGEKEKRAAELIIANKELVFQNNEKGRRAAELNIANEELIFQNGEKEKRAAELIIANKELVFQNREKEMRAAELLIANKELVFQNREKEKRAAELAIANKELVFQNVEKEKRAAELINANRLYVFLSEINQTIVHSKDEQTVFKEACRIAYEFGKFKVAWICQVDRIGKKLDLVQESGMAPEDLPFFCDIRYENSGPRGNVVHTGKSFICNDVDNDERMDNWKTFASKRGWRSYMVLPIKRSGNVVAVFNIVSSEINFFNSEETSLLNEASGDISFALDVFEIEKNRKRMEDTVIHNELRLKQAQSIAHYGNWELDFSSGLGVWSEEACRIYGLSPNDNVQSYQTWISFIHPGDLDYVMKITKKERERVSNTAFYHRIVRRDGAIRHIYSQAHFESDKAGKPIGLYSVVKDVTERVEAEQALILSEAERTKMVADLIQRNKDLEQFSYIVSHNLRAPLANILGLTNVIETIGFDADEERKIMGYISIAANRLDSVIRDITYILELKHNVNEKRQKVILSTLLNEIKSSIDNVIIGEQVQIISDFSAIDEIQTIKSYLYSIFLNLISNSVKYRQHNTKPVIEITSTEVENKIRLVFKDNGLGIDLNRKGKEVFGLYKRFHNHVEGKGMGLFMVKTQVQTLGGTIAIASEVNNGTTFTLEFEINKQ